MNDKPKQTRAAVELTRETDHVVTFSPSMDHVRVQLNPDRMGGLETDDLVRDHDFFLSGTTFDYKNKNQNGDAGVYLFGTAGGL